MKNILSKEIRPKQTLLTHDDCRAVASLMKNGFSLPDTFRVIRTRKNEKTIEEIRSHLIKGEKAASFFAGYCAPEIRKYLGSFLRYMNFEDSLDLACGLLSKEKQNRENLLKGLFYPVSLLCATIFGILAFNRFVLPSMMGLMHAFQSDTGTFSSFRFWTVLLSELLAILLGAICLAVWIFTRHRFITRTYCFVTKHFGHTILTGIASRKFILYFQECLRRETATRRNLTVLKELKEEPLVSFIASELDASLEKGTSLEAAVDSVYVEDLLQYFFRIAMYASDTEGMLEEYLRVTEIRTKKRIRILTKSIQIFCYCMIGGAVIFIYQILMMPMMILQNI